MQPLLHALSFYYNGPPVYIAPEIFELYSLPSLLNAKICKKDSRKAMVKQQSSGNTKEWQSDNFLLFNIPGLRGSPRNVMAPNYHLD